MLKISDDEVKNYHLLGKATAQSLGLAFHLANQHCPDFENRVAGYKVVKNSALPEKLNQTAKASNIADQSPFFEVEFYENKEEEKESTIVFLPNYKSPKKL